MCNSQMPFVVLSPHIPVVIHVYDFCLGTVHGIIEIVEGFYQRAAETGEVLQMACTHIDVRTPGPSVSNQRPNFLPYPSPVSVSLGGAAY
jgi:hypothetical protein